MSMFGDLTSNAGKASSTDEKIALLSSPTGISTFDSALGGGFPVGSVVLVAGSSGSGKTIFSFQWLFEGTKSQETSMYITLTEPLFNTLKNLETMDFYDEAAVEQERLKILDLRDLCQTAAGFDPEEVLNIIEKEVQETNAKRLVIDSITAIAYTINDKAKIRQFIFELGKMLATLGCTAILTSEVAQVAVYSLFGVEEFISDLILRFDRFDASSGIRRKVSIVKVRGRNAQLGSYNFKITEKGICLIPKIKVELKTPATVNRVSIGNAQVDILLNGGVLEASSTLVAGSTGTGKSLLGLHFLMDSLQKNEACLFIGFEEGENQIKRNAKGFGWDLTLYENKDLLFMRCMFPREKLLEEHLADIKAYVDAHNIKRCVVDSLSAVANAFPKEEFAEFAKKLNGFLKSSGITSLFVMVNASLAGAISLTDAQVFTIMDNIIMLRHVEMEGKLQEVMNIVKIRGSSHSKELIEYDITNKGLVIVQSLEGFEGILTGVTRKVDRSVEEKIRLEFKRFLGPDANNYFKEAKKSGLQLDALLGFIDSLIAQGKVKDSRGTFFKENIKDILAFDSFSANNLSPAAAKKLVTEFFEDEDVKRKRVKTFFSKK